MDVATVKAIVTGGTSGLGASAARSLHEAGASVVVLGRDLERGKSMAEQIGGIDRFVVADVADDDAVAQAVSDATERLGGLNTLVHCAGIGAAQRTVGRHGPAGPEVFEATIRTNVIGTYNIVRHVAARIAATPAPGPDERGVVVLTTSIAGFDGQAGQVAYATSKGALASMTLPLARELAPFGVRVVAVAPGVFDTPMLAPLPEAAREGLAEATPLPRRMGQAREFGEFMVSVVATSMLNGEIIRLDGGLRLP